METQGAPCTDFVQAAEIFEYVFDTGVIRGFDETKANAFMEQITGRWNFGCSTCCKVISDGTMLIGRNMDLCYSHRPVFIISTEEQNCYKTKGLSHYALDPFPTYDSVRKNGIPKDIYNVLPYIATDSINTEGLYVEVNMRNEEKDSDGKEIFGCKGTNPDSRTRINVLSLPTYLTQRCRNVDEALALVKKLDVYTIESDFYEWPLCCTIADADGHYGVLEFGMNKAVWNELAPCQTNFYLNSEMNSAEKYKTGIDRYNILIKEHNHIESREYLWSLLNKLSYRQVYDMENSCFDLRTEFVNPGTKYTTDYVLDEANREEMNTIMENASLMAKGKTSSQLRDESQVWYSMYSIVTDCNNRTMEVRFFEDSKCKTVISLENSSNASKKTD